MSAATKRIRKIMDLVYDPATCALCGGTGTRHGRRKGTRDSGCAQCMVRSTDDLKFLVDLAVRCLDLMDKHALR